MYVLYNTYILVPTKNQYVQYIVLHNTLTRGSGLCITLYSYVRGREPKKQKKKSYQQAATFKKSVFSPYCFRYTIIM